MVRRRAPLFALLAGLAVLSCADPSKLVAPKSVPPSFKKGGTPPNPDVPPVKLHHVFVLKWTPPLKNDLTASAVIGPEGGTITLTQLGATFTVPAGALTQRTTITVRAIAGKHVVFQMAPAGLHFATPATLTMSLAGTNGWHKTKFAQYLRGGYIPSVLSIGGDDGADDTEDFPALVDDAVTTASWPVPHFSVVILASQRKIDPGPAVK